MRIKSIQEFKEIVNYHKRKTSLTLGGIQLLFRGHALDSYENLPTLCREKLNSEEIISYEKLIHEEFKSKIKDGKIGSVKLHIPKDESSFLYDWYLLFQERHLELPSRLLDWTMDDLVALYFAVSNDKYHGIDGHVWILPSINDFSVFAEKNRDIERIEQIYRHMNAGKEDKERLTKINPFDQNKIRLLHNSYVMEEWEIQIGEKRRASQRGKFIVLPNNIILCPLDKNIIGTMMMKIEVDGKSKADILKELQEENNFSDAIILPEIPLDTKSIIQEIINVARNKFCKIYPNTNSKFKAFYLSQKLTELSVKELTELKNELNLRIEKPAQN